MKKLSKRMLALMLALVMAMPVILAMPFSASANAGNVYEYLNNASSLSSNTLGTVSNVVWDNNENAAYFSGDNSYLTLANTPLASVTADSGFTVSVDVKRDPENRQWARVFDFGNGTNNHIALVGGQTTGADNDKRFALIMKKSGINSGNVRRYLADGSGEGTVLYSSSDWLATERANEWHSFKFVLTKVGAVGWLYYYVDDILYYIYEVADYNSFFTNVNSFLTTYYIGQSQYSDNGTFKGFIKNLRITTNSGVNESLLFDYDFGSNFNDSLGNAETCGAWQANGGGSYGTYGDHIYMQNCYLTTSFPDSFRSEANKKNWRVDFAFNFVSGHDNSAELFVPVISLSNNPESNSDYNNSFTVGRNGKIYYKTSDINNYIGDTGVDFTGSGNEYVANKSRQRVSIAYSDGKICVYYNDILKFKKDNLSSDEKTFFENIYGANICGNGSDVSWMDIWDFRAYNNSNSNHPSFNQLKILGAAAKAYEDKMQEGTVFTNVKNAYDKYVELNKLVDAISQGSAGVSDEVAQNVANNLNNAKNNMGTWSSRTFSVPSGSENKWNSHDAHGATVTIGNVYHNVLWSGGVSAGDPGENNYADAVAIGFEDNTYKSGSNKNSIRPVIYRESAVLVYTGRSNDDPRMPVMFRCRGWRSGSGTWTQRHRSVYIDSNGQGMYINSSDNWHGTDGQLNYIYTMFHHPVSNVKSTTDSSSYNDLSSGGTGVKKYCYANILRFNGSGQFSSNQYSKTINGITWGFKYSNNNDNVQTQTATEGNRASDKSNDSSYDTTNKPIYVINYKAVIDALGNAANGRAKQVANYKEGGLSTFFTNYENAENFNPASYDYSDTANKVNDCANAISSVISNLGVSPRDNVYSSLKNALYIKHDQTGYSAASDMVKSDEYTTSSYNTFKAKYIEAQNKLARLVDNGYSTDLGSIASDLNTAHGNLEKRADFSTLDSTFTTVQGNYNGLNKSVYTPNSCTAFESYMNTLTYHSRNAAQRADTGVSSQSSINSEETAVSNAISTYVKERANLQPFFDKYEEIDGLVSGFDTNAAMYTETSLQALIDALNDEDVQKYIAASDETVANYEKGGAEEAEAADLKDELIEAYNNLKDADQGETEGDLDLSAYQAVVYSINNIDVDAYDYPQEERERDLATYTRMLTKTVDYNGSEIKVLKDDVSNSLVDAVTSFLQSRANSHIREYRISVSGVLSGSNPVVFSGGQSRFDETENAYYATYGTKISLKAPSEDAAWFMEFYSETASRNEQYQDRGRYFSANVFGNLNITVKTRNNGAKVTIYRAYNDNDRTPVSIIDYTSSFTVPNASVLPYYTFTGYTMNGESISSGTVLNDLSEDVVIYANYEAAAGLPFAINVEDDSIAGTSASYNDGVSFKGKSGTYAWLEKIGDTESYRPFYIGRDVAFFATESTTLKPVTEEEFTDGGYDVPNINLRQSGTYVIDTDGKKRVTFNGQFVTDGVYTISEYGVLLGKAAEGGSIRAADVAVDNVGVNSAYSVTRFKSTKDVGAHQFTMSITGLSGEVIYKGYITYTNALGTAVTVYTEPYYENI